MLIKNKNVMKHRIKIKLIDGYPAVLQKRKYFFNRWKSIGYSSFNNNMPYSEQVIQWIRDYSIPDKRVTFNK